MSVFAWGFGKCGQLGNGGQDTRHTPRKPCLPDGCRCKEISCGGHYTAVVTDKGEVYTFGCGKHGRLGTGKETDQLVPVRVKGGLDKEEIEKISCGIWHGAAVSTSGNVYTWGYGKHGVQGNGESPPLAAPTLLSGPFTNSVRGVACGNNFTLLWTKDGAAFSWGCGRHGVLGQGDTEDRLVPTQISELESTKVIHMNAGFAHSGAVTETGTVYMFGKAEDGALGLGKRIPAVVATPIEVTACKDTGTIFTTISCSVGEKHGHTLFLDSNGQVFSCGDGYKGKLGHDDQESRYVPTLIQPACFNKERIVGVSAGGIHSAAVSLEGHVFTWGCGSDGRLGHPEAKGHRYLFRSDIPKLVEAFVDAGRVVDVKCSYYHTVVLVEQ